MRHPQPGRLFADQVTHTRHVRVVRLCLHIQVTRTKGLGPSNPNGLKTDEATKMCRDPHL